MSSSQFGVWLLVFGVSACLLIYRIATTGDAAKAAYSSVLALVLILLMTYYLVVRLSREKRRIPPSGDWIDLPVELKSQAGVASAAGAMPKREVPRFRYRATIQLPTVLVLFAAVMILISQRVGLELAVLLAFLIVYHLLWRPWVLEVSREGVKLGFILRRSVRLSVTEARIEFAPHWRGVVIKVYSPFLLRKSADLRMPEEDAQQLNGVWRGLKGEESA